ncbi:pecanex-like protein 2 [Spea bombifrons]|uniref:pecanex-like protein 2 n=1 Tax=Spea bombifrons TaxID=233779 RepID=UPI002348F7BE|nr:pecanex-like protein 2 [Spea bombifrons]
MTFQVLRLLRQGMWAALTGGWFHDPEESQFNNICHLYLWLFLLSMPLMMHLCLPPTMFTSSLSCSLTAVLFAGIKLTNYWLHQMFDKGMEIHQKENQNIAKLKDNKEINSVNITINPGTLSINSEEADKKSNKLDLTVSNHSGAKWKDSNGSSSSDSLVVKTLNSCEDKKENATEAGVMENVKICETLSEKFIPLEQNEETDASNNGIPYYGKLLSHSIDLNSESMTCSESEGPFVDDPDGLSLQQPASLNAAKQSLSETPKLLRNPKRNVSYTESSHFPSKVFYKFCIFPEKWMKSWYDRLTLLALLDRTEDFQDNIICIFLAVFVSFLGFMVLMRGIFKDFWIFQFCVVIASCQFSLLKSVQPDPASPVHGYNQIITYSRPIYFCMLCSLILLLDAGCKSSKLEQITLYGIKLFTHESFQVSRDQVIGLVSGFPILSLLGLFPQINTFFIYLMEQIDTLVFGGSAAVGFAPALHSLFRSIVAVAMLYGFCIYSLMEPWDNQHIPALFSAFCGLLAALSYHLSRQGSDPSVIISLIKTKFPQLFNRPQKSLKEEDDLYQANIESSVKEILKSDVFVCTVVAILSFAVSTSTVFLSLRPFLSFVLSCLALTVGFVAHYVLPQLRKHHPWLLVSHPVLQSKENRHRDIFDAAHVTWYEKKNIWLLYVEKYILYPSIIFNAVTTDAFSVSKKPRLGVQCDALFISIAGIKLMRLSFCNPCHQFITLGFTILFFQFDYRGISESFLMDLFIMSILFAKLLELYHKLQYILPYIAPWQIAWGSSFHVFAQIFSIPHTSILFFQTVATSIFSTPLSPFLGSSIFIASYTRPVKFWEKNYNTEIVDHSNTRLINQMEEDLGNEGANNLNAIFYEHLTRSLQNSLCGDLILGRWGNYTSGDCFILASEDLNAFVHLIETGNGFVTFQVRGLEFRGTYCQQREVEAIMEGDQNSEECCCCHPGHFPHVLSCNAAFNLRWRTWEVIRTQYILEGYSVIDNNAATMLQVFDLQKILIKYFMKSIIYFTARSSKLAEWIKNETILKALYPYTKWNYIVTDLAIFNINVDEDYIPCLQGITRASFCSVYLDWIQYCAKQRQKPVDCDEDSPLVTLSFGLCIVGRRVLRTAANRVSFSLDSFLCGLHTLFKGDCRVSVQDEWVFADMDLLHAVISPAVKMSLKLHQDQFACPEEYEDTSTLYEAIQTFEHKVVICHEGDPVWRKAILSNKEELLTLRHVINEGNDEYKVIMLHKNHLCFRVIKVNKECVRGLWAGQQQELIFLRNRDPERGSIQNNKHVLRNLINSSCDQPLGYPIYVSPLTTSYAGTHRQLGNMWGGPVVLKTISSWLRLQWLRITKECDLSHNTEGNIEDVDCGDVSSLGYGQSPRSQDQCAGKPSHLSNEKYSMETRSLQTGKRKFRSRSVQAHKSLIPATPVSSRSGSNLEKIHLNPEIFASDYKNANRLSVSQHSLNNSTLSPFQPTSALSIAAHRNHKTARIQQSSQASSTSSTLSFLFGKRSISSALVISGLSVADGENTIDTLSSSSVNIVMCPDSRGANHSTQSAFDTSDNSDATNIGQIADEEHPDETDVTPELDL